MLYTQDIALLVELLEIRGDPSLFKILIRTTRCLYKSCFSIHLKEFSTVK